MAQPEPRIYCRFDDPLSVQRAARVEDDGEAPGWHTLLALGGLIVATVYGVRRRKRHAK